ncbi:hypothetical protein KIN20_031323 [Parelaphostrongylus tenuis]|uniref:Uncharacterized protein n=1 Tax=Parelaphostrongylus tenuis TaxID=148309 RepID=A0AAD5R577_PARTN|nr:hypothetical protein KIN20_031323 [Parelaphostrongylus tenuis]
MLHEYKLGSINADAACRIKKAWSYRTAAESTVRERFREFKDVNEELTDRPRSGHPTELDDEDLLSGLENQPSSCCKSRDRLSINLGIV